MQGVTPAEAMKAERIGRGAGPGSWSATLPENGFKYYSSVGCLAVWWLSARGSPGG